MQSLWPVLGITKHLVRDGERLTTESYWIWYWHTLIEHYWARELTMETDRLVALEGVVDTFRWRCSEYYAGIWGIKPLWQLTWHIFDAGGLWKELPRRP